jgi:hypothetical protein
LNSMPKSRPEKGPSPTSDALESDTRDRKKARQQQFGLPPGEKRGGSATKHDRLSGTAFARGVKIHNTSGPLSLAGTDWL